MEDAAPGGRRRRRCRGSARPWRAGRRAAHEASRPRAGDGGRRACEAADEACPHVGDTVPRVVDRAGERAREDDRQRRADRHERGRAEDQVDRGRRDDTAADTERARQHPGHEPDTEGDCQLAHLVAVPPCESLRRAGRPGSDR